MIGEFVGSVYVGCATDSGYANPTCAMLSSVDDNANLPEANIIVGDFGLTHREREDIILSAGRLGDRVTFITLGRDSPEFPVVPKYDLPLPLLARLITARLITTERARLITLDSDMIVNRSLRPLFEMSMRGAAVGAVQDPISIRDHYDRKMTHDYFNAGMMLIDVDKFNEQNIGERALELLSSHETPTRWLDQDSLNTVIDGKWLNLDRRWNFFHAADRRAFTIEDYERADVIHYSGGKPWNPNGSHHPAARLFFEHRERAAQKCARYYEKSRLPIDKVFAAMCYEVLLGRSMESEVPYRERLHLNRADFADLVRRSPEFENEVIRPLWRTGKMATNRFPGRPSVAQRYFVAEYLGSSPSTAKRVVAAARWEELVTALVSDDVFMRGQPIESLSQQPSV